MRLTFVLMTAAICAAYSPGASAAEKSELTVIVMDPLSAPLSCPCVAGYAQRDYEKLGKYLEKALGRPVKVHFSESLTLALKKKTEGKADIIIGKESVVRNEAAENKLAAAPIASLTGKDGKTTMTGLFVVGGKDPAITINDLKGYRILFGVKEADEKHAAAFTLMKDLGMKYEGKIETCPSCSDGATKVVDGFKGGEKIATVVSSYAQPLLEGCGTIKKGDVRVVGETDPVPFIVAFASNSLPSIDREAIQKALFAVAKDAELCKVMETKLGFVAFDDGKKK
jgi:ABC-type phosphate/phosphonate transport system substrate-binding protein